MALRRLRVLLLVMVVCVAFSPRKAESLECRPSGSFFCPGTCSGLVCEDFGPESQACKIITNGCFSYQCSGGCP